MAYQPNAEEKQMGMLSHLLCIFTVWLGPLIIFLTKGQTSPFIKLHSKQALFWGVAISVLWIISGFLMFVVIGIFLLPAVGILHLIFTIMGTIKVNNGEKFLYPLVAEKFCKDEVAAVYGDGGAAPPAAPKA